MRLHIAPDGGVPIYQQIVNQMKYLLASGRLAPGDEVPPIRTLAEQLLINPNTVARAYRELEVMGLFTKRQGAGTYVSGKGSPLAQEERLRILREKVDALLAEAEQLGVSVEEVSRLIAEQYAALRTAHGEENTHETE